MATLHAAAVRIDLRLRDVHSLKAKRHRMKHLSTAVRKAYPVAFAEIDHQDQWQRAGIGVGIVSSQASQLDMAIHAVRTLIEEVDGVEVLGVEVSYLEEPGA